MKGLIRLIRPLQWLKNGFVFLPLFFGGRLIDMTCWHNAILVFFAFSMTASSIYCLNDLIDIESDRKHPKKRFRPIAAGIVSEASAKWIMAGLLVTAALFDILLPENVRINVAFILILYVLLNIAYCLKLKQYAIIDVFIVSMGFVMRLVAGGEACRIWLSPWIVLMTFLLALFISFAKRRDDVVLHESNGLVTRKNILRYNLPFMNQTLGILGSITMVCYITYTVSPDVEIRMGSEYVYVTSIFVLAGILRYMQVSIVDLRSGSPTKVLAKDRFIQVCIFCWLMTFLIILYF